MQEAAAAKGTRDRAVETFAKYYTPVVVLLAVLLFVLGVAVNPGSWRYWCYTSLVVLVTACPCALVISTPVASVSGIARAAKQVGKPQEVY
jgi:Cd2+/Zn2+-exporting ATPase